MKWNIDKNGLIDIPIMVENRYKQFSWTTDENENDVVKFNLRLNLIINL
jgi:hypothetical protein